MSSVRFHRPETDQQVTVPSRSLPKVSTTANKGIPHRPCKLGRFLMLGVVIVPILISLGWWRWRYDGTVLDADLVFHTVQRAGLDVTVTERGNLESQVNVEVVCEVDDVPGDNINGTPILWIVDNGASVSEGDLIVELDAAPIQERLDSQVLAVEEERSEYKQCKSPF